MRSWLGSQPILDNEVTIQKELINEKKKVCLMRKYHFLSEMHLNWKCQAILEACIGSKIEMLFCFT